ncbi:hypothetical protein BJ912DRAFT_912720 [Pholiota molesta]|nr:hypothetical protein BJ912DRAFT_912720 [Pholiota molesta]
MGYRSISTDIKECALRLWDAGWSKADICGVLCISRASLYRWAAILDNYGSVRAPPPPIRGRPRIIGMAAMTLLTNLYTQNSDLYLDEVRWHLAIVHDIPISLSALQETLERAGLTRKMLHKIALERNEESRADKNEHTLSRRYGRALSGQDALLTAPFIRGERYSLVAAMSQQGYIAAHIVPGSLDAFAFFDFIVEDVLPVMKPFPDENSVLIMDNCRIHHTETLQEVLNDSRLCFLQRFS